MNRIADIDETLANFLGIEKQRKSRAKRSWAQVAIALAPYILEPAGKILASKLGGGSVDTNRLQAYDSQIAELYKSQKEVEYMIKEQMTMFMIDSERKNVQIQWLERSQAQLEQNIKILENSTIKDAQEKQKEINSLKAMLEETNKKIKMQKDIQDRLVNDINEIKNRLKSIDDDLKYIKSEVSKNRKDIDSLMVEVKINAMSINFNFLLSRFETEQKTLFDVIKNANRGDLDPYIITPLNLIEMMQKAHSMLPENTKFPFYPNFENAQKLYNLIEPTVYLYNKKILFILSISVVSGKTFDLHKITSLPIAVDKNTFAFVLPKQPYLAVDVNDEEYTTLSSENMRELCKSINKTYICEQIRHTSHVFTGADCEMAVFGVSKKVPDSCNKRLMYLEKPVFLQLQEPMAWIYAVPSPENVVISCRGHRETVSLHGSGFLKMNRSCTARTIHISLFTVKRFTSTIISSFSPRVNIVDSIDLSNVEVAKERSGTNYNEIISPFDYKELEAMSVGTNVVHSNVSTVYILLAITVVVSVVLLIVVVFRRRIYKGILQKN